MTQLTTVFFDGHCGLCHRAVRCLIAIDRRAVLRFAPLDGPTSAAMLLPTMDSIVVMTEDDRVLMRSTAVSYCLNRIGGPWCMAATILGWIPTAVADQLYDLIASNRRAWFAQPITTCPRLPVNLQSRFLP